METSVLEWKRGFEMVHNLCEQQDVNAAAPVVFKWIPDEWVAEFVGMSLRLSLNHRTLGRLHNSFTEGYWKDRFKKLQQPCFTIDERNVPDEIGLIQFGHLLLRHSHNLQRSDTTHTIDLTKDYGHGELIMATSGMHTHTVYLDTYVGYSYIAITGLTVLRLIGSCTQPSYCRVRGKRGGRVSTICV